jgi:hypothetical protein
MRKRQRFWRPSRNPSSTTTVDPVVVEFFPELGVKDNHRSSMTEFSPKLGFWPIADSIDSDLSPKPSPLS